MDLPKNITQIGASDRYCKVYVEDYVVSHIKQLNRQAENKDMAVALYGVQKEEDGVAYLFCYGAAKLQSIQKEVRHISQAQHQEIEKLRKTFFADYDFLGYRLLNGDMVEGFHICENGICRYVAGYACFYEKNDAMLAYMLDSRKEEAEPENVDLEKYERVKKRQEERKQQTERKQPAEHKQQERKQQEQRIEWKQKTEQKTVTVTTFRRMKTAVAAAFLLLCVLGITGMYYLGDGEDIQTAADKLIAEFSEQKLPDVQEEAAKNDTLVTEDKLTEALQQENASSAPAESEKAEIPEREQIPAESQQPESEQQAAQPSDTAQEGVQSSDAAQAESQVPDAVQQESSNGTKVQGTEEESKPVAESEVLKATSTYTIRRGDTLSGISVRTYGTDARVKDICELNGIENPDDIRFGQKILLP